MGAGQAAATLGRQPGRNGGDGVGQRLDRAGRGLAVVDLLQEGAINTQPELSTVRGTYRAGGASLLVSRPMARRAAATGPGSAGHEQIPRERLGFKARDDSQLDRVARPVATVRIE